MSPCLRTINYKQPFFWNKLPFATLIRKHTGVTIEENTEKESQTGRGVSASGLWYPWYLLLRSYSWPSFKGIVLRWRARASHVKTTGENTLNQNKHVQDNNPPCRISVKQRTPDLTGGARLKAVLWQLLGDCRGCLLTQNELISPRLGFIGLARA